MPDTRPVNPSVVSSITAHIDAVTGLTPEYATTKPPAPKSVKIELTGRCNFSCAYCARAQRLRDQRDMDRGLFERLMREMRGAGVQEIGLFYLGESMLVPWLADAVRFAKEDCGFPYVFLTTNGSLATEYLLRRLFEAGLDSLKFSLNYATPEQFGEITSVNPRIFDRVLANVKASRKTRDAVYQETGRRCGLYASYIEYNGAQAERMTEVVAQVEPYMDEVYALPLYNQAALLTDDEESAGWTPSAGNRGRAANLREPLPCWSIFTEGHISWDGKLSACCFDHDGRFHMGDLTEVSFMEAWHSDKFQALREANLRKDVTGTVCEKCVACG